MCVLLHFLNFSVLSFFLCCLKGNNGGLLGFNSIMKSFESNTTFTTFSFAVFPSIFTFWVALNLTQIGLEKSAAPWSGKERSFAYQTEKFQRKEHCFSSCTEPIRISCVFIPIYFWFLNQLSELLQSVTNRDQFRLQHFATLFVIARAVTRSTTPFPKSNEFPNCLLHRTQESLILSMTWLKR